MSSLKNLRRSKNWSQQTLAEEARVSINTISNYERGIRCPRIPELRKIAAVLGCSVVDLIDE